MRCAGAPELLVLGMGAIVGGAAAPGGSGGWGRLNGPTPSTAAAVADAEMTGGATTAGVAAAATLPAERLRRSMEERLLVLFDDWPTSAATLGTTVRRRAAAEVGDGGCGGCGEASRWG